MRWTMKPIKCKHGIAVLKCMKVEWEKTTKCRNFEVGNGKMIMFWTDIWCDGIIMAERYKNLYNVTTNKEVMVADVYRTGWAFTC